jgi:hypothetical protein
MVALLNVSKLNKVGDMGPGVTSHEQTNRQFRLAIVDIVYSIFKHSNSDLFYLIYPAELMRIQTLIKLIVYEDFLDPLKILSVIITFNYYIFVISPALGAQF